MRLQGRRRGTPGSGGVQFGNLRRAGGNGLRVGLLLGQHGLQLGSELGIFGLQPPHFMFWPHRGDPADLTPHDYRTAAKPIAQLTQQARLAVNRQRVIVPDQRFGLRRKPYCR